MNRNMLKAEIVKNGLTQAKVAESIGMSQVTFSRKLKRGVFGIDEAEKLIGLLDIKDPNQIFFNQQVT